MMDTFPWTRSQTWGAGIGTRFLTLLVGATLATGFLALTVTTLVLRVARASTPVLTIQRTLARVLGVVNAFD